MERELTFHRITHPDFLFNGWQRVDHPVLKPLVDGEPVLGWEGDPRLVVYTNREVYVLHRLEHDNEYRAVCHIKGTLGIDTINTLIMRLVEIDGRRGWDPEASMDALEAKRREDRRRNQQAFMGDFADKFHFGLSRSHIPGISITRIRNAPTPKKWSQ